MDTPSSKRIKEVTVKPEEDMKKPLSKINEDPEHYRIMFSGPVVYIEDLKPINPKDSKAIDWENKGVVPKSGNANYKPSAVAIANTERVAKRNSEEAFDKLLSLKKSIKELEGIFKFNFNYFIQIFILIILNVIPWLTCTKCREFPGRIEAKCLEAQDRGHGVHWLPKQKKKINDEQKHHYKAFHQDKEPLIYTLLQVRMQLRKLEPTRPSMVNLPRIQSFYKPRKYFGGFYI